MRVYVGFDDTDTSTSDRGTGKLARWFEKELPAGYRAVGVVRQQLLVDDAIPYTSHNSSACVILESDNGLSVDGLIASAVVHLERHAVIGSDPGLCVVRAADPALSALISFGLRCTNEVVSQREAIDAARGSHLSGHGGTSDGIIGAAAAVGLTASGQSGRFIEFGRLRDLGPSMLVSELERSGIRILSVDREAQPPSPDDIVETTGWVRPRLWDGKPLLLVLPSGRKHWEVFAKKRSKQE
jgi:hypothetical protein